MSSSSPYIIPAPCVPRKDFIGYMLKMPSWEVGMVYDSKEIPALGSTGFQIVKKMPSVTHKKEVNTGAQIYSEWCKVEAMKMCEMSKDRIAAKSIRVLDVFRL